MTWVRAAWRRSTIWAISSSEPVVAVMRTTALSSRACRSAFIRSEAARARATVRSVWLCATMSKIMLPEAMAVQPPSRTAAIAPAACLPGVRAQARTDSPSRRYRYRVGNHFPIRDRLTVGSCSVITQRPQNVRRGVMRHGSAWVQVCSRLVNHLARSSREERRYSPLLFAWQASPRIYVTAVTSATASDRGRIRTTEPPPKLPRRDP